MRKQGSHPYGLTGDKLNEYFENKVEDFVYNNQYESIKMLNEQECLQFIHDQRQGKLR